MQSKYSVSLVMPVYNEEQTIAHAIDACNSFLSNMAEKYEIIVVDDGSKDRTWSILDNYSRTNSRIKPIRNRINLGSGRSLFIGLKKAQCDIIMTNFADLPFDIRELNNILAIFDKEDIDFVVVKRKDRKANPIYRKITSLVNYWLIRNIFNVKVGDFQFVQAYKKKVIEAIDVQSNGTFVPPEIIIKALRNGFKIEEYSACFYPRRSGSSKCGNMRTMVQTLVEMIRFRLQL